MWMLVSANSDSRSWHRFSVHFVKLVFLCGLGFFFSWFGFLLNTWFYISNLSHSYGYANFSNLKKSNTLTFISLDRSKMIDNKHWLPWFNFFYRARKTGPFQYLNSINVSLIHKLLIRNMISLSFNITLHHWRDPSLSFPKIDIKQCFIVVQPPVVVLSWQTPHIFGICFINVFIVLLESHSKRT